MGFRLIRYIFSLNKSVKKIYYLTIPPGYTFFFISNPFVLGMLIRTLPKLF